MGLILENYARVVIGPLEPPSTDFLMRPLKFNIHYFYIKLYFDFDKTILFKLDDIVDEGDRDQGYYKGRRNRWMEVVRTVRRGIL